jgi:hypothetical protein
MLILSLFSVSLPPAQTNKMVIEVPLNENQPSEGSNSLADAFKNRPKTSKKRPNKQRQALKKQAIQANSAPFVM